MVDQIRWEFYGDAADGQAECEWRAIMAGEASVRAARPTMLALYRVVDCLEPWQRDIIHDAINELVYELTATSTALHVAMRQATATPETTQYVDREARLRAIAESADIPASIRETLYGARALGIQTEIRELEAALYGEPVAVLA